MDFRKVFDLIPDEFDKWRPRYCPEAFEEIIRCADLKPGRTMLEIGPGTGQATEPLLQSGCDYTGLELGEHLYHFMKEKFAAYPNCHMINGDFCTYDFGSRKFDLVFSAATIQWIPEEIAFSRCFDLLKPGGYLIMIANIGDYDSANPPELLAEKEEVYDRYFKPETPYTCRINKNNAVHYGFDTPTKLDFTYDTEMSADEFVCYTMTHADHIQLAEPNRTLFMEGLRSAVNRHGGVWKIHNIVTVVEAKKPL
jgi:SAM-dependent methyltransferase